jgi:hypothetical protein
MESIIKIKKKSNGSFNAVSSIQVLNAVELSYVLQI